ncbi:MAG: FoF1 ATP synthase subunit a [Lachnospiraceae bacterium]
MRGSRTVRVSFRIFARRRSKRLRNSRITRPAGSARFSRPYMMSLALFMILSAATELFGQRAPTSDLLVTLSMSLITFFLINYYGIKKKKLSGRLVSLTKPTPLVTPFKIISDIATPVSLACRLFGNMLGGMIVMDLLKSSLGGYAVGIPAVAGLYFNLFHPLIQTYIFVILSLTFINEAAE